MTTPPDPNSRRQQRKKSSASKAKVAKLDGNYIATVADLEVAARLGRIASGFAHLENDMGPVFNKLMGAPYWAPGGIVLRALRGARVRFGAMDALLAKAPHNAHANPELGEILSEFARLNTLRNAYVHALWYTHTDLKTGKQTTYLSEPDEHVFAFLGSRRLAKGELPALERDIARLIIKVWLYASTAAAEEQRLGQAPPPGVPDPDLSVARRITPTSRSRRGQTSLE